MARLSRKLFGSTRGAVRRRRLAEARSLGVEHLDRRQMLSANAMASFADTGHGLAYEIKSLLPTAEYVRTSVLGRIAPQVAKVQPAVLSAKPTVSFSNGVLTVTGTSGADSVEVRQNGDRIEVVGADVRQQLPSSRGATNPVTVQDGTASLPASLVKQIKIDGGAGDDTITVKMYDMSADVITKVSIDAGAGNDRVEVGVDGAMAKKVFADLGKGADTLELPTGVTLGTQKQAERVNYVAPPVQNWENRFGALLIGEKLRHQTDLERGVLRGTMEVQMGTLYQSSLTVTRTTDGYVITQHQSGCFNVTDSSVSISDAALAGPAAMLTNAQKNALDALHRMLSAQQPTYYGKWYDGPRTGDFQDGDGDGIDDRDQRPVPLVIHFPGSGNITFRLSGDIIGL